MSASFKPVAFDPYGRRRTRVRLPRWLMLLLLGVGVGAGGVIYVQQEHLPPRLTASASAELRAAFQEADGERQRLRAELADTSKKLQAALAEGEKAAGEASASRATVEQLRADIAELVEVLPPDPRGGAIEVRAAKFAARDGGLAYDVVLSRGARAGARPMAVTMQLVVSGEASRNGSVGGSGTSTGSVVNPEPIAITVGSHESLRGHVQLPAGFMPRQATIRLLDKPGGRQLGMRVLPVK